MNTTGTRGPLGRMKGHHLERRPLLDRFYRRRQRGLLNERRKKARAVLVLLGRIFRQGAEEIRLELLQSSASSSSSKFSMRPPRFLVTLLLQPAHVAVSSQDQVVEF